jgi:hypothetical protein
MNNHAKMPGKTFPSKKREDNVNNTRVQRKRGPNGDEFESSPLLWCRD